MLCCICLLTSTSPARLFSNWSVSLDTFCCELLPHFNRSWRKRQLFDTRLPRLPDMAVFDNCSVLFELRGLSFKEKKKVKSAVTGQGGNLSFVVNKQVRELSARGAPHGWILKSNFTKLYFTASMSSCSTWLFQYNVHNMFVDFETKLHHEWSKSFKFSHIYRNM